MSNSETISETFNKHVMPTYAPGVALVKGRGSRVWDADGKVYLDFGAGISVVNGSQYLRTAGRYFRPTTSDDEGM